MAIGLEKIRSAAESFASLHAGHHAIPVIRPVTAQGDPKNCDLLVKTGAETPQKQENATL